MMAWATVARSGAAIAPSHEARRARQPRAGSAEVEPGSAMAAQVLASLGHELRAPLASLRATLELLAEDQSAQMGTGAPAVEAALVARLESGLEGLERLVDNLSTW